MGNTVDKMRQRELARRQSKREELVAYIESSKRRHSILEINGQLGPDEAQQPHFADGDRQAAFGRGQLAAAGLDGDDDHRLTDRDREAWLYRMENEALEVMNDNMELQEERRRERERREERREELENMGVDGVDDQGDDANFNREEAVREDRSPASSRRSSPAVSEDDDTEDDDFASDGPDEDDFDFDDDGAEADEGADEESIGAESDRGEPEPAAEEVGGGDDEEQRRGEGY